MDAPTSRQQTIQKKVFNIEVLKAREDGGRIRINTASVDRDRDRVFPNGAQIENYLANPVVQWGHNYREPWAIVGKTDELIITDDFIDAEFSLRPAASESDPQKIVLLLWNGGWVRTASIGFMPDWSKVRPNEMDGLDFMKWELLEWSLVAIPANQDALRQNMMKLLGVSDEAEVSDEPLVGSRATPQANTPDDTSNATVETATGLTDEDLERLAESLKQLNTQLRRIVS